MKKSYQKAIVQNLSIIAVMFFSVVLLGQDALALQLDSQNLTAGGNISQDTNIIQTVFRVINFVLAVAGGFAVLFIIIGGFRYITSAGNDNQVESAKNILTYSVIGLVVVLLAFVIASTINGLLLQP